jgi:ankyrin repeat protein
LLAAARLQKINAVKSLLRIGGVDGNARGEFGQTAPFEVSGDLDLQLVVLRTRTDLNTQDLDGNTALMHAIRRVELTLVCALITQGIDLEIRNFTGVLFIYLCERLGTCP